MTAQLRLADGRAVTFEEYGDPNGRPALWFHGGFSSRLEAGPLDGAARELGVRIISLDRPGVGGSDAMPSRSILDYAKDVAEILDLLGVERAVVGGLSNGGMYTMAIASAIPHRVVHAVPVNSTTPIADKAALAALSRKGRMSYAYMTRSPEKIAAKVRNPKPQGRLMKAFVRKANPDAVLLEDPATAAAWQLNTAEAMSQPAEDYLIPELVMTMKPWGFDHRAITVPVRMVSGELDAGLDYAKIWAAELPHGELVIVPRGHTGILDPAVARRIVEVLAKQP